MILFVILIALICFLLYLTSGKKQELSENTIIETKKNVQEVADSLRKISSELNASVEKLQDDPFGQYGVATDIAVVLFGAAKGHDYWVVQVYVVATKSGCNIELIALGENLPSAYTGTIYTGRANMKFSKKNKDLIASRLR